MQVALIVGSELIESEVLPERFDGSWRFIKIETPGSAVMAVQAILFDAIVVPTEHAEDAAYMALLSTMRLVAPTSRLVLVRSSQAEMVSS